MGIHGKVANMDVRRETGRSLGPSLDFENFSTKMFFSFKWEKINFVTFGLP